MLQTNNAIDVHIGLLFIIYHKNNLRRTRNTNWQR